VRRRVLIAVLAVTTLAVVAFFVPAALSIRSAQQRQDELELQREASVVATKVAADGLSASILEPINADHVLGLYGPDGRLLAGEGPQRATDDITRFGLGGAVAEGRTDDAIIAAVPVQLLIDGSAVVVRIEAPLTETQGRYARSLLKLGAAALAILAVATAVAIWLSRRLNRPIDDLRDWADTGEPGGAPDRTGIREIDSLRDALVQSREHVDELLQRERSFSSQVSHQLRTPVAAMRVAIETELAAPRPDPNTVLRETVGQLDRLESTITSLLALARDRERTPVACDIDALVRDRVTTWTPAARAEGRSIDAVATAGWASIDADAVGHVLDVLVDNALRHGAGSITVTATRAGDRLDLDVADEGRTPVSTDAFADRGSDSSHGLGLRLARSLAEGCRGTLILLPAPTTTFRLTLPVTA
jgi:signal transduction histidine kinase